MKNVILFFALAIFISSCSLLVDDKDNKEKALNKFTNEAEIDIDDYKAIIFTPLEGCGSCIQKSIDFYQNNSQNTDFFFIFCTYKPYAYDFLKNNENYNIFIDKKNIAIKNYILSTAPVVYKKDIENNFKYLGVADSKFNFSVLYND